MIESARPAVASTGDDYEYLVQGLAAHFDISTSQRTIRIQFRSLCQAETESAIDFARRVQYVGRQCNFGSDEAALLVDQLIVGLASDRTRERLLTEGPALTFDKAIEVIQTVTEGSSREGGLDRFDFNGAPPDFHVASFAPQSQQTEVHHRHVLGSACGRCGRLWHPFQQCPALGKTCFQCGKIGHLRNACRTPRSATTHPSSPHVKRYTLPPLRNIEAPPDDEQEVVVVNQLGLHATPTSQESYSDVKVNDSLLSLLVSELAQSRRRESQLAEEMRQLKSQLADLREQLPLNSSELEESTSESQEVQEKEADKAEGGVEKAYEEGKPTILKEAEKRKEAEKAKVGSEKADEADKPEGSVEKDNEEDKPKIEGVEYDEDGIPLY
ncbi:hypothetical protein HPB48_019252 [Haemaphysalis longicornis]|uniref:CCHC-type domain-containing protein n=1 Tax=Haemaphysalis longicornis TaxID=44386 RepID=A0A9J6GS85_HAELO|nr:hypothetical protein HPB48_019252 [Haemaphysalis longicornis]